MYQCGLSLGNTFRMFNSFSLFVSKYFLFIYCFLENFFKLNILYEDQQLLAPFDRVLYTLFNDAKVYNSYFSSRKIGIVTLIGGQVENEIETEIAIGIIVETRVAAIDTAKVGMDIR